MAAVIAGCQKQIPKSDKAESDFFNVVYMVTKVRAIGSSVWYPVQGIFEAQFVSSQENQGSFTMSYSSYLEPQFCPFNQNCVCSGGIEGSYIMPEANDSPKTETPYNPLDPYSPTEGETENGPIVEIDPKTGEPKVSLIYTFFYDININKKSLSSGCKPEANRQIKITRFSNGEAIMTNDYREQYLVPVVISED